MMPQNEVKLQRTIKVGTPPVTVVVQSGDNGWTILYADHSSEYEDVTDTAENNYNKAINILNQHVTDNISLDKLKENTDDNK